MIVAVHRLGPIDVGFVVLVPFRDDVARRCKKWSRKPWTYLTTWTITGKHIGVERFAGNHWSGCENKRDPVLHDSTWINVTCFFSFCREESRYGSSVSRGVSAIKTARVD